MSPTEREIAAGPAPDAGIEWGVLTEPWGRLADALGALKPLRTADDEPPDSSMFPCPWCRRDKPPHARGCLTQREQP